MFFKIKQLFRRTFHRDVVVMYTDLLQFHDLWNVSLRHTSRDYAPNFYVDSENHVWVSYNLSELYHHCPIYKFKPYVPHREFLQRYYNVTDRTLLQYDGEYDLYIPELFEGIPSQVYRKRFFGVLTRKRFLKLLDRHMKRYARQSAK